MGTGLLAIYFVNPCYRILLARDEYQLMKSNTPRRLILYSDRKALTLPETFFIYEPGDRKRAGDSELQKLLRYCPQSLTNTTPD